MEENPPQNPRPADKGPWLQDGTDQASSIRWGGLPSMQFDASEVISCDVFAVQRIQSVATLLQILCNTTGMRLAGIARVTEHRWTLCAVHDATDFGLKPGSQLDPKTTFCFEVNSQNAPS